MPFGLSLQNQEKRLNFGFPKREREVGERSTVHLRGGGDDARNPRVRRPSDNSKNLRSAWPQNEPALWRQRFHLHSTLADPQALREARKSVAGLLPPGATVRKAEGVVEKGHLAFFEAGSHDSHLFIKVRRAGHKSGPWFERAVTLQASAYGFAPRSFPAPQASQSIVLDFQKSPTLSFQQSQDPEVRNSFLDLMRSLHATTQNERPDSPQSAGISDWLAWRERRLQVGVTNPELLNMDLVGKHMEIIVGAAEALAAQQRFCHYDTLPRNIYWTADGIRLIDWEMSQFGDPIRDLAKYFGATELRPYEANAVLARYYQRAPTLDEETHLLRLVQAHSVDFYLHALRSKRVQTEDYERQAQQIVERGCALTGQDTQIWWLDGANPQLVQRSALIAAANAAAKDVLGPHYEFENNSFSRSTWGCATFRARNDGRHIFIKIEGLGRPTYPEAERTAASRAAQLQISPAVHLLPDHPYAIVTDNRGVSLEFTQTLLPSIRQQFISHLRQLHRSQKAPANLESPDLMIGGWTDWKKKLFATTLGNQPVFHLKQLEQHMDAICAELTATAVTQAPCHYDTLRRNMVLADDRLWLVDWGLARWGDPIRDLAKFFGFNGLYGHEAATMLSWYYERKPTGPEERHFLLLLQAMAVDHLSYMMKASKDRTKGARHKVPQILSFAALLDDLPQISVHDLDSSSSYATAEGSC